MMEKFIRFSRRRPKHKERKDTPNRKGGQNATLLRNIPSQGKRPTKKTHNKDFEKDQDIFGPFNPFDLFIFKTD